jgi:carboxypeptidase Q
MFMPVDGNATPAPPAPSQEATLKRGTPWLVAALLTIAAPIAAQTFPTDDPVIRSIWGEGTNHSQVYDLAQVLLDSIGPRLTASPAHKAANDWLVQTYGSWGIQADNEQYGTWESWRRGITHVDLIQPRIHSLDATMLAWSPGTTRPVEGDVVALPDVATQAEFQAWLPSVKGKFVLVSVPEPTCRPMESWQQNGGEQALEAIRARRSAADSAWDARIEASGGSARDLPRTLEAAGAAGVLSSIWSGGWGAQRIFSARTQKVPSFAVGCEDYGLLYRLAANHQGPRLRVEAQAQDLGQVPVFNTIAEIRGSEKPDEYIVLSAHLDSWDGAQGATDNGTGTVIMLEAMRLLKNAYPHPKRTIIVGHWGAEEEGLIGSRAYAADHPEVVKGLQALFNQDNGTGQIVNLSMQGFTSAGEQFAEWLSRIPEDLTRRINLRLPGTPGGGGSDYASFVCYGAPSFSLSSSPWDYFAYTWHTNLDTFDKLSFDNVRENAILTAMLVYLASEAPDTMSRDRRTSFPASRRTGEPMTWPQCSPPRTWEEYFK